jgi:ribose transport system permease protein
MILFRHLKKHDSVIRSGCSQMGLPNWVQEIVTGVIIVVAMTLDRLRRRRIS